VGEAPIALNQVTFFLLAPASSVYPEPKETQVNPFPDAVGAVGSKLSPRLLMIVAIKSALLAGEIEAVTADVPSVVRVPVVSDTQDTSLVPTM
jgi:hypothetical protein